MSPLLNFLALSRPLPAALDIGTMFERMPVLTIGVPLIFVAAYLLVMLEEVTDLRKSKPVILAAGLIWTIIAIFPPLAPVEYEVGEIEEMAIETDEAPSSGEEQSSDLSAPRDAEQLHKARAEVGDSVSDYLEEYAQLFLFLLAAMTYVNALEERRVFAVLRDKLISSGMGYRSLFWATGFIAFFLSPMIDNMTTALVVCGALTALGHDSPRFVALGCINVVVAANAGGAFSPFGDITTLLVWQHGVMPFFDFFDLFVPALVNFLIPAACMHFAVPPGQPPAPESRSRLRRGAIGVIVLFALTIATAVVMHKFWHLPPVLGMMTGLAYLKLYAYYLQMSYNARKKRNDPRIVNRDPKDVSSFDSFELVADAEWDTLLFFYGVTLCVGGMGYIGYLAIAADYFYGTWGASYANIAIGLLSSVVDNIPVMMAVLEMDPEMSEGQWLLVTFTAGVGGSILSIGSAAGIALMGQSRGVYSFGRHLVWAPAILLGYAASIAVHFWWNAELFH